jgi:uncharacterized membrane protein YcgQ (UPF0703/DUF1980 family)
MTGCRIHSAVHLSTLQSSGWHFCLVLERSLAIPTEVIPGFLQSAQADTAVQRDQNVTVQYENNFMNSREINRSKCCWLCVINIGNELLVYKP